MARVARYHDSTDHGGQIQQGCGSLFSGGVGVALLDYSVSCPIHGTQHITEASSRIIVGGKGVARLGDLISCGARITSGSDRINVTG